MEEFSELKPPEVPVRSSGAAEAAQLQFQQGSAPPANGDHMDVTEHRPQENDGDSEERNGHANGHGNGTLPLLSVSPPPRQAKVAEPEPEQPVKAKAKWGALQKVVVGTEENSAPSIAVGDGAGGFERVESSDSTARGEEDKMDLFRGHT